MRKYDRSAIKNTYDKQKDYKFKASNPIKAECLRMISLSERMTEIYEESPSLFTEHHIVLNEFLFTCSMASTNEPRQEPWFLNDKERLILQFVRNNYTSDWQEHLNNGKYVNWLPATIDGAVSLKGFDENLQPKQ